VRDAQVAKALAAKEQLQNAVVDMQQQIWELHHPTPPGAQGAPRTVSDTGACDVAVDPTSPAACCQSPPQPIGGPSPTVPGGTPSLCATPHQQLINDRYGHLEVSTGRTGGASKRAASPAVLTRSLQGSPLKRHACLSEPALPEPQSVPCATSPFARCTGYIDGSKAPVAVDDLPLAPHPESSGASVERPASPVSHHSIACGPDECCNSSDHQSKSETTSCGVQCDRPACVDASTHAAPTVQLHTSTPGAFRSILSFCSYG
jgi:hypothetical protein